MPNYAILMQPNLAADHLSRAGARTAPGLRSRLMSPSPNPPPTAPAAGASNGAPAADAHAPPRTATSAVPVRPPAAFNDMFYANVMAHFYRGELGRIMAWRQRLDVTTTWAITGTTTIFTVAFTVREVPHIIFFFNLAVVTIMLWIEARRYRHYDAYRARVRMLEAHFILPVVIQNREPLEGEWRKLVAQDLVLPVYKISRLEAVAQRVKRNYVFLYALILVAWTVKIIMHAPPGSGVSNLKEFYALMAVGHLPAWATATCFLFTAFGLAGMLVWLRWHSEGSLMDAPERERMKWRL